MDERQRRREVKVYLSQYKDLRSEADSLQEEVRRLKQRIELKSPQITGMPKGGVPYTLQDYVADAADLIEDLNRNYEEQVQKYREIEGAIRDVGSPLYRLILRSHYLAGESLRGIAEAQGYSVSRIEHIHLLALDSVRLPEDF